MTRGKLDRETASKIEEELPETLSLQKSALNFMPDFISMGFPVGSSVPIAAVCLQDTTRSLQEARYAVFEAHAHVIWYREKCESTDEFAAVFFGKFYADDAALRLYAAGEHMANAIINMLDIRKDVSDFKKSALAIKKNVMSRQSLVGSYLVEHSPSHPITKAIIKLKDSAEWKQTRKYRDDWVHNKPPIIEGMGIDYERRNRLIVSDGSIGVSFGGGDEPQLSVDGLLAIISPALRQLAEAAERTLEYYVDFLSKNQKTSW